MGNWAEIVMGKKLIEVISEVFRSEHYAYRTEETYLYWIRLFISFYGNRHPRDLGKKEIQGFLTHLAMKSRVSAL